MTSVNEEAAPAPQQTSTLLEPRLRHLIARIEGLSMTIEQQSKIVGQLVQDNISLRDELSNLSRTFQLSKRDLQRVENTIPKLTTELKTKFEKMLEKSEGRIQGPIDRLLEELGRIRACPPTPVHVSSITTFPQNTQFVAESQTEGEGSWAPPEDYNPPGPSNKQHYQEHCEPHVQPVSKKTLIHCVADLSLKPPQNNNYSRGGYRYFRGRGRGPRGGYAGNRHGGFYPPRTYPPLPEGWQIVRVPPSSNPAPARLEQAPTPAPTPVTGAAPAPVNTSTPAPVSTPAPTSVPVTASTPRHSDSYHSQGPPPPPSQQSHAYYPQSHAHPAPPHYDAEPPTPPQRHRPARLQAYRERSPAPLPPSPVRGTYTDRAPTRARSRSFGAYRDDDQPAPVRPRSHSRSYVEYRDDDQPRVRSEAPDDASRDDSPPVAYSPVRSDEQQPPQEQQRWPSPSVSPSEHAVHHRHRRYHDDYRQQQQQQQRQRQHQQQQQQQQQQQRRWRRGRSSSRSRTGSRSTSESRGYVRRGPGTGNDVRGGRR